MADEQILYIKANIDDINAKLDQVDKNLEDTQKTADKTGKTVEKGMKDGSAATDGLNTALDETGAALGGVSASAGRAFTALTRGLKSTITGLKGVRLAIIGTGIGAFIIAVISLTQAFQRSEEGQNKFAKIMGVIGVVTNTVLDLFASLGEKIIWVFENPKKAITDFTNLVRDNITNRITGLIQLFPKLGEVISLVFKREWKEAGKVAADAIAMAALGVDDFVDKTKEAADAGAEFIKNEEEKRKIQKKIEDDRAKADKLERDLIVRRSEIDAEVADLRLKAREEEKFSAAEREGFLRDAAKLTDELADKEVEMLTLRRDAIVAENTLSKSNKEAKTAEAEAIAAVNNANTKRLNDQRMLQRELLRTGKQQQALTKAEIQARLEADALIDEALRTSREQEIFEVRQKYANLIALAMKYGRDTIDLERQRLKELNDLDNTATIDINAVMKKRVDDRVLADRDGTIQIAQNRLEQERRQREIDDEATEYYKNLQDEERRAQIEGAEYMFAQLKGLYADNAAAQKAFAVFDSIINAYIAINKVLAEGGIAGPILAVGIGALAFANVAKILSEPIPEFFHGTDFVERGKNPKGRDTIPAKLNEGEAVIPTDQNRKYPGLAKAWITGDLDKYIAVKHVIPAIEKIQAEKRFNESLLLGKGGTRDVFSDGRMVSQLRKLNQTNEMLVHIVASQRRGNPFRA